MESEEVVVIEVENGTVVAVHSTNGKIGYIVIDWDNIKEGDKINTEIFEPDTVDTLENILRNIKGSKNNVVEEV